MRIKLAPDWGVLEVMPIDLAAIKPGSFIGATATGPNSHLVAVEVHVLPEAARGSGEGHYAWDLQPQSTTADKSDSEVSGSAPMAARMVGTPTGKRCWGIVWRAGPERNGLWRGGSTKRADLPWPALPLAPASVAPSAAVGRVVVKRSVAII